MVSIERLNSRVGLVSICVLLTPLGGPPIPRPDQRSMEPASFLSPVDNTSLAFQLRYWTEMNLKEIIKSAKVKSGYSLATPSIDKGPDDRVGPVNWLGRTSTKRTLVSANVAKYKDALKTLARELSQVRDPE